MNEPGEFAQGNPAPHSECNFSIEKCSTYTYESLADHSSVRLLVVESGLPGTPLRCQLQSTNLEQTGEYDAISYVWGTKESLGKVICQERIIWITKNLEDALQRVRHPDHSRVVWADAICIDQQNIQERGHQVKLMPHIYSRASRVLVWLGSDLSQSSEIAFALVKAVYRFATQGADIEDSQFPMPDNNIWTYFQRLFDCAWFWRLWVVQEITSAPNGLVMWGKNEIEWTKIGVTADRLRATGYGIMQHFPMPGAYNAHLMYAISEEARLAKKPASFIGLMMLTRQFQSTDHRDRVYALLGLPHRDKDLWSIEPDYTKTVNNIYLQVTQKALLHKQKLTVLSAVQHGLSLNGFDKASRLLGSRAGIFASLTG